MATDETLPPYLQVAGDLEADILSGRLVPGDKLRSLTTLSQEYGFAKNTIVKALKVLQKKGLIETHRGWGTFVKRSE